MRAPHVLALLPLVLVPLACGGGGESGASPGDAWHGDAVVFLPNGAGAAGVDAGGGAPDVADAADDGSAPTAPDDATPAGPPDAVLDVREEAVCGDGSIFGLVCDRSEQAFVGGAAVRVDAIDCNGNLVRRLTVSDEDGYFTLAAVPDGLQTVLVKKADFELQLTVLVVAGALTDVTGEAHEDCSQPTGGNERCVKGQDQIAVETPLTSAQADIVWFIDTSGSMEAEANWLQQNMNAFAQYIGSQQIDYHVILIADGYDLCVPPPLGGPGCTDGPRFRHVHQEVDSHDGLEQVIDRYPEYKDFLRAGATTNFVAVSDDNSDRSASWFQTQVASQTGPGFSDPFVFHSIVAYGPIPIIGCITGAFGGLVYLQLTADTGGAMFPICETNWANIFGDLAETVVETVQSTCTYALPNPEAAATADLMSLAFLEGGHPTLVPKVVDADGCGAQGGWYIDDTTEPAALVLCPATCRILAGGVLQIAYDCFD